MKTENTSTTENIFSGLKVVDLSSFVAGPGAAVILSDFGADVIKVEPPGGSVTRTYGPFYQDRPDPNGSLYFWHYNRGARGLVP